MAYKEDIDSPLILTIGTISGFLVIVCVIGLQAWFMGEEQTELDEKYAESVNARLVELRSQQQGNINTYRWIGDDKKVAAIPIDQAMILLIQNKGKLPSTKP